MRILHLAAPFFFASPRKLGETLKVSGRAADFSQPWHNGFRMDFENAGQQGFMDLFRFGSNALLAAGSFIGVSRDDLHQIDEPFFMLRASLACDCSYATAGLGELAFRGPGVVVAWIPAGQPLRIRTDKGRHQIMVLLCRGRGLAQLAKLPVREMPPLIRPALDGTDRGGILAALPLDATTAGIVGDMIASPMEGEMRCLHARAKTLELIAWTLRNLEPIPHPRPARMRLRSRDLLSIRQAHDELASAYARPPTIQELSRRLGMNQTKLKYLFRETYGVTIHNFCIERRIQEAQRLLLEGEYDISQIAERVGYQHQSSFALAFKKHCGTSPRDYRKTRPMKPLYIEERTARRS